jgi:hypothetical protein
MLLICSVAVPPLVSVTALALLVAPTTTVPNDSVDGVSVMFAPLTSWTTVRLTVVVFVKLPDTPWIVTLVVPKAAVPLAVKVNVLLEDVGFGLNPAVTPFGRPEALKLTLPEKPLAGFTVIVVVTLLPGATLTPLGLALKPKPPSMSTTIGFDSMPLATTDRL